MTDFKAIDHSHEKLFEATLQKVREQLDIKRKDSTVGLKLLTRFDELKNYKRLFVHKVTELKGNSGSFIILLVEKHLTIIQQKKSARVEKEIEEVEPVLIFSIPHDIGRAYTRKETLADKVADLFTKVDIDFVEYPDFSKNYYVMAEKPDLIKRYLPKGLIASLDRIENMTVEINGNWGLLRTERNLTENILLLLIGIGYKMVR
jgi:hypothetical protein